MFEQFEIYEGMFWFLFDLKFSFIDDDSLTTHCVTLEEFLKHVDLNDIDGCYTLKYQKLEGNKIFLSGP